MKSNNKMATTVAKSNEKLYAGTLGSNSINDNTVPEVPYKDLQVVIERMSSQCNFLYSEINRLYCICHRIGYGTGENELDLQGEPDGDSYLFKINGLLDLNDTLFEKLNYVVGRIDRI